MVMFCICILWIRVDHLTLFPGICDTFWLRGTGFAKNRNHLTIGAWLFRIVLTPAGLTCIPGILSITSINGKNITWRSCQPRRVLLSCALPRKKTRRFWRLINPWAHRGTQRLRSPCPAVGKRTSLQSSSLKSEFIGLPAELRTLSFEMNDQ